jgi:hypothetical protein
MNTKSLFRFGDEFYVQKNGEFVKYKSIEEYVESLEGVPFKLAMSTTKEMKLNTMNFLKTFVGQEIRDLVFDPSVIQFNQSLVNIISGQPTTPTEYYDTHSSKPVVSLPESLPEIECHGSIYEAMFKTLNQELMYGILGYILDPEPHSVWDSVCVFFKGRDTVLDELMKLLEILFGPTMKIGSNGLRHFNKSHLKLVIGYPDDDDVESLLSTKQVEGEKFKPKLMLMDSDGCCKSLFEEFNHRIVCLSLGNFNKLITKHEWRCEIPYMVAKISVNYKSLTNRMIEERIHPCDLFEKDIYTPTISKKRANVSLELEMEQ